MRIGNSLVGLVGGAVVWLAAAGGLPAAVLLSNAGFEYDAGTNFPGWQPFGANVYNLTGAAAHGGTNYVKVYQTFSGQANYSGLYQDYISGPGAAYAADGWVNIPAGDLLAGQNAVWLEVSFRDAAGNTLALYRSAVVTANSISTGAFAAGAWHDLAVTNQYDPGSYQITNTVSRLVAPAGTVYLRYQILFQGDANYSGGSAYFDDLNLVQSGGAPYGNLNIVWSDEFDGPAIKTNLWTYDLGAGGWGNNELEYYTNRTNNAFVSNGLLHIVARQEAAGDSSYTSARLKSQGLYACQYGRLEWRVQLPPGVGCWPAVWLLGTNITTLNWPGCGEIDVMENNGSNPFMAQGSIHSGTDATAIYYFTDGLSATNFHTYTLDWSTNYLLFYVDGHLYQTQTGWGTSTTNAFPFPFNQPFFLIMNLAIGGNYLGNPTPNAINAGTVFPAEMQVDYVRLYSLTDPLALGLKRTGAGLVLSWPSNIVCHLQTQTNRSLNSTSAWFQVATNTNYYQVAASGTNAFFRLTTP